mmetsp:Transcript_24481/g.37968  ORF Transcript_24481/g.37968 Transcript_24481/m.37968 type:complete len:81 (+) Transcript_24481:688-930(+)
MKTLGSPSLFKTDIDRNDLSDTQLALAKDLNCQMSLWQVHLMYFMAGTFFLGMKIILGLFCFNVYLLTQQGGLTYIEFKK